MYNFNYKMDISVGYVKVESKLLSSWTYKIAKTFNTTKWHDKKY